jgi:hypothetical protein
MQIPRYDRPGPAEHAAESEQWIAAAPEGDLLDVLDGQILDLRDLLRAVPEQRGDYRYAPGKWTLKEVLSHVIDLERVYCYRALWIARGDEVPLPGYDGNDWVPLSGAPDRTVADLLEEFHAVRVATVALLVHLPADAPLRRGTASDSPVSVRALAWMIAGHAAHHIRLIRERYLG